VLSSQELFILFTRLVSTIVNLLLNFDLPLTKQIDYIRKIPFIGIDLVHKGIHLRRERLY
jgi:hypothetical protein